MIIYAKRFKSLLGRQLREILAHLDWLRQPRSELSIIIFPWSDESQGSSKLRAFELGKRLKTLGWRVTLVPKHLNLAQRKRLIALHKPKIGFIQKSRHPLNRAHLYPEIPLVFDLDDADYHDDALRHTIEECCRLSKAVICGSATVANWCSLHNPAVHIVWTSNPAGLKPRSSVPVTARKAIVAWGCSMSLDYPAEVAFMKEILTELAKKISFEFWLYGVSSESKAAELFGVLQDSGVTLRYFTYMPYQEFLDSLTNVAVGLNPLLPEQSAFSEGKSFGKVLAYLAANVAIVASDAADHRQFFVHGVNGMIAETREEWVNSIYTLLTDATLREKLVETAYQDYTEKLTTEVTSAKTHLILKDVLDNHY